MKTKVYEIYDIEDSYPYERFELTSGTLEEVAKGFKEWLDDHLTEYDNDEEGMAEWKEDYEDVLLFVENPNEWIKKYGDDEVEIYMDWMLRYVCTVK